jgi:hypothetical protein
MKKEDAKYINDFLDWITENVTVAEVDKEHFGNGMLNSFNLLQDVVSGANTGQDKCHIQRVNNCPAWLDKDDFEFAKELYKENKLDAVKYLMPFARLHVTKPLKTCKELLEGCC